MLFDSLMGALEAAWSHSVSLEFSDAIIGGDNHGSALVLPRRIYTSYPVGNIQGALERGKLA